MPGSTLPPDLAAQLKSLVQRIERLERQTVPASAQASSVNQEVWGVSGGIVSLKTGFDFLEVAVDEDVVFICRDFQIQDIESFTSATSSDTVFSTDAGSEIALLEDGSIDITSAAGKDVRVNGTPI